MPTPSQQLRERKKRKLARRLNRMLNGEFDPFETSTKRARNSKELLKWSAADADTSYEEEREKILRALSQLDEAEKGKQPAAARNVCA